jgi:quercetin dioxygenase-like cupin family protein
MREPDDDPIVTLARAGLPPPLARPAGADPHEDPFEPLLRAAAPLRQAAPGALRQRLFERVAASAAGARGLSTQRASDAAPREVAPGVTLRALYRAAAGLPRRPGEPDAASLVELAPRAAWRSGGGSLQAPERRRGLQRECLVLRGQLRIGGVHLHAHDYHVVPADAEDDDWSSEGGALLYHRASQPAPGAALQSTTQRAASAEWSDYAPGIRRRLLWRQGPQAAMLYHALPGAAVPHHGHRHDEECLMLAGDFFLDEVLLRALDYQLAPAGTAHHVSSTDTGVLLFAHGDVDLDLK